MYGVLWGVSLLRYRAHKRMKISSALVVLAHKSGQDFCVLAWWKIQSRADTFMTQRQPYTNGGCLLPLWSRNQQKENNVAKFELFTSTNGAKQISAETFSSPFVLPRLDAFRAPVLFQLWFYAGRRKNGRHSTYTLTRKRSTRTKLKRL